MTESEAKEFIQNAFQKLIERGLIKENEISPSTITDTDIELYEKKFNVKLPSFFKMYLKSYSYEFEYICAPVPEDIEPETIRELEEGEEDEGYYDTLWLQLMSIPKEEPFKYLCNMMEGFRSTIESTYDILQVTMGDMKNFVPIGDWGAGWGPLLIDLSKPDEEVDINDEKTWNLVWFDHEDFPWKEPHVEEQDVPIVEGAGFTMRPGVDYSRRPGSTVVEESMPTMMDVINSDELHDIPAAPNLKILLEWYFCGKFDKSYEAQLEEDGEEKPDYSKFIDR